MRKRSLLCVPLRPLRLTSAALLLALLAANLPARAKTPIGEVQLSRGGAVAEQADSVARILGKGSDILRGDALTTEDKSFLVIRLEDQSKLTLRPASRLTIETFSREQARLYLERGGVQAETGRISKGKSRYRLRTPHGDMQLQGARFNARLCNGDCAPGQVLKDVQDTSLAARVVKLRGSALAERGGQQHPLQKNSALYPGDTVLTSAKSQLAMAFRDGGRISLIENSRFAIERFEYQARPGRADPDGKASYELIKGGLRAVTGAIGKAKPEAFELKTPVTTIGVRGTGFDSICRGDCIDERAGCSPGGEDRDGLYNRVWSDTIVQRLGGRTYPLEEGQASYLPNRDCAPIALTRIPDFLENPGVPRPDTLDVDVEELFETPRASAEAPGLYVYLERGSATLEGLTLSAGQAGYSGQGQRYRLDSPQEFQLNDPAPEPWLPQETLQRQHSLLSDDAALTTDEFSCKVR